MECFDRGTRVYYPCHEPYVGSCDSLRGRCARCFELTDREAQARVELLEGVRAKIEAALDECGSGSWESVAREWRFDALLERPDALAGAVRCALDQIARVPRYPNQRTRGVARPVAGDRS